MTRIIHALKNKSNVITLLIGVFVLSVFFLLFYSDPIIGDSDITIHSYDAEIIIDEEGSMIVEETWSMTYEGDYSVRFRDIEYKKFPSDYPFPYSTDNKAQFDETYASVYVEGDHGSRMEYMDVGYSFNNDLDELGEVVACPNSSPIECESIFIHEKYTGLRGNRDITYRYKIDNVITEYSDVSELNWVLFEYAETYVKEGTVSITVPESFSDYLFYSPHIGNVTNLSTFGNKLTFTFEDLNSTEQLAFRLLVPTDTFDNISNTSTFIDPGINKQLIMDFEENILEENLLIKQFELYGFFFSLLSILIVILLYEALKRTMFKAPLVEVPNYFSPPTEDSPAVIGYLYYNEEFEQRFISATLLDLVNRDYLRINDDRILGNDGFDIDNLIESEKYDWMKDTSHKRKNNSFPNWQHKEMDESFDIDLYLNKDKDLSTLKPFEKHLIEWYIEDVGDGEKVSLKDFKEQASTASSAYSFSSHAMRFKRLVRSESKKVNYYDKGVYRKRHIAQFFQVIPALFLATLIGLTIYSQGTAMLLIDMMIVACGILYLAFSIKQTKMLSVEGAKFYKAWGIYKDNLLNQKTVKESSISDIEYLDQNLVYATIFDIAEQVVDDMEAKYPTDTENSGSVYTRNYYSYRYHRVHFIHFHTSHMTRVDNKIREARKSSSSGGGFSGGGSSGGGGGGGRSR